MLPAHAALTAPLILAGASTLSALRAAPGQPDPAPPAPSATVVISATRTERDDAGTAATVDVAGRTELERLLVDRPNDLGTLPFTPIRILASHGDDLARRSQFSLEQRFDDDAAWFQHAQWRAYYQAAATLERTLELRDPGTGPRLRASDSRFSQSILGARSQRARAGTGPRPSPCSTTATAASSSGPPWAPTRPGSICSSIRTCRRCGSSAPKPKGPWGCARACGSRAAPPGPRATT